MAKMPLQKPHESEQVVGTPWALIDAVERRWGPLTVDLSASFENTKAPLYFDREQDGLKQAWPTADGQRLWCNPEFNNIAAWAEKAANWAVRKDAGALVFLLTPASVGANWYWDHVHGKALVLPLSPRFAFQGQHLLDKDTKQRKCGPDCEGCSTYPKDLMLSVYGEPPGFERWRWKESLAA